MGVGVSLVMIAIGAICTFALTAGVRGINMSALGIVLMVVGTMGLVIALLFWESYAPFSNWRTRRGAAEQVVIHDVEMR